MFEKNYRYFLWVSQTTNHSVLDSLPSESSKTLSGILKKTVHFEVKER